MSTSATTFISHFQLNSGQKETISCVTQENE